MKKLLILPAVLLVIWTGIALYWQIRIGRALRVFETTQLFSHQTCSYNTPPYERASHELLDAGVRALPALVRSLTTEKRPVYQTEASVLIRRIVTYAGAISWRETEGWRIDDEAPEPERAQKCRMFQDWWFSNKHRIHRWWCPWDRGYRLE